MAVPYDDAGDNIVVEPEIAPESDQVWQDFVGGQPETPGDSSANVEWIEEP